MEDWKIQIEGGINDIYEWLFKFFYINKVMEETIMASPNNDGRILKLEIKQKNTHLKKRKVKTWTPEEDEKLIKLYDQYPKKWGLIAGLMTDRNQNQCLHRYRRLSQLGAHKKIWSAEQDHTIISLIKKVGKNWKLLSEIIGTKTGKQIRERFINKLDPKIKNEEWTDEEDRMILQYYSEVGSRWSEISKRLPGRPENKIKNRFYSFIQKNYDIKYTYVDAEPEVATVEKPEVRKSLRQISLNQNNSSAGQHPTQAHYKALKKEEKFPSRKSIPSIKELEDEFKIEDEDNDAEKDEIFDSNIDLNQKFCLRSLVKVEDEMNQEHKYRSIRDLISHNEIENDLFYLSQH